MRFLMAAGLLLLAACGKRDAPTEQAAANVAVPAPRATFTAAEKALLRAQPLQDAIHRALTTGENQRWSYGGLSGYAVPSLTRAANGCRAVRYTVDQRPTAEYQPINACEGSR